MVLGELEFTEFVTQLTSKTSDPACCKSQEQILLELEKLAPGVPFLALGQTVFWDEPMKAGVVIRSKQLGLSRPFIAGVHDTDYFAKFHRKLNERGYKALTHNDTTTKGLWSAAGEFSTLFGSETVITREKLLAYGAKVSRIEAERPGYLDEMTEAWGWKGVVSLEPHQDTIADKQLSPLFFELNTTFRWAVDTSLNTVAGPHFADTKISAQELLSIVCDTVDEPGSGDLAGYYQNLLPKFYDHVAQENLSIQTTRTTELLRFTKETCRLPRFKILDLFLNPETSERARTAYDASVSGSEIYTLDRFGVGAVPFDVYIPGRGRGTLRIGERGIVIMTPNPMALSYEVKPKSTEELAQLIENKFGDQCSIIGKAVSLIGMLASEFVFVFHHGASSYVHRSRNFHQQLIKHGLPIHANPILRVKLDPWKALESCCAWFKLPEPLQRPFGVEELSSCSLAARQKVVAEDQRKILEELKTLSRPLELIRFLDHKLGGQWNCLASQYESLHRDLEQIREQVQKVKIKKTDLIAAIKTENARRDQIQKELGIHWRERIFENSPSKEDELERKRLQREFEASLDKTRSLRRQWTDLQNEQLTIVSNESATNGKRLRHNIAFEAELYRMKLIREAIIASEGMEKAGYRPSAWWFSLVCPNATWFRATSQQAHYELEPLI